jgi:hypothetical protein
MLEPHASGVVLFRTQRMPEPQATGVLVCGSGGVGCDGGQKPLGCRRNCQPPRLIHR